MWRYHRQRLLHAASVLKIDLDISLLEQHLEHAIAQFSQFPAVIKIILGRAPGKRGAYAQAHASADIIVQLKALPNREALRSCKLVSLAQPLLGQALTNGLKLVNRLPYLLPSIEGSIAEDAEALFLDENQHVVETMHHNIFILKGVSLLTPSLQCAGVEGTLRAALLDGWTSDLGLGLTVQVAELGLDDLFQADAVFLTNALDGILAVSSLNSKPLAQNAVVRTLSEYFQKEFS